MNTVLKTRWYHFYTIPMLLTCGSLMLLIILNAEMVWKNFNTNVAINSVIWTIIIIATLCAFYNNRKLRGTVMFLKKVEDVENKEAVSEQEVNNLKNMLKTQGRLLDTANMEGVMDRLGEMGYAQFTDNDARLVKSKFGYRVRDDRHIVSYFAGILVMLGLIGTFWGLLITIDSVGKAMVMVSESFGSGEQDISKFLSSISTPLSGMGLAFSSSLFGLSGSLFLGFLNFFAGRTQNETIEMFSRWADDRIPSMNAALKKKAGAMKTPAGDDLKAWLAGFVYLSTKMHRQIQSLTYMVGKSAHASYINSQTIEKAISQQHHYNDEFRHISRLVEGLSQSMEQNVKIQMDKGRDQEGAAKTLLHAAELLQHLEQKSNAETVDHQANLGKYKELQEELSSVFFSMQSYVSEMHTMMHKPEEFNVYDIMEKYKESEQPAGQNE